MKSVLNHKNI